MPKQNKRISVYHNDVNYALPKDPKEFLEFWQSKLDLVPAKYKHTTKISVEAEGTYEGGAKLLVSVFYFRPETDEEEANRTRIEKERADSLEERELRQLEHLKNKYDVG